MPFPRSYDRNKILDAWVALKPIAEVAAAGRCDPRNVWRIVAKEREAGDPRAIVRQDAMPERQRAKELERAVLDLVRAKPWIRQTDISAALGCKVSQVNHIFRKHHAAVEEIRSPLAREARRPTRPDVVMRNGISLPRVPCIDGPAQTAGGAA